MMSENIGKCRDAISAVFGLSKISSFCAVELIKQKQFAQLAMTEFVLTTKTDLQDLVREAVQQAMTFAPKPSTLAETPRYYDVEAAADYMGCAPTTIYAYLKKACVASN